MTEASQSVALPPSVQQAMSLRQQEANLKMVAEHRNHSEEQAQLLHQQAVADQYARQMSQRALQASHVMPTAIDRGSHAVTSPIVAAARAAAAEAAVVADCCS